LKEKGKRGTWGERKSSSSKWVLACLKSNPCHQIKLWNKKKKYEQRKELPLKLW